MKREKQMERRGVEIEDEEVGVAKVVEITSSSPNSFEDAIEKGIQRAAKTLDGIRGAWVQQQTLKVQGGRITEYRVNMKVTFLLEE